MNIVFMSMDTLPSTLWARDLYDQMHIRSDFRKWFPRMCQYGFIEGRDYEYMPRVRLQDEGGRTVQRCVKDYRITQDMAKKLCKLHHTAVGVVYRPQPFDRDVLLGLLHKKPPRRSSYEAQLSDSDSLVTTTQIAKEYGCGAKVFNRLLHLHGIQYRANNQWVLYAKHQDKGYVCTDPKGTIIIECGKMLSDAGYKIKVLNTINFKKSMHYNPFHYIRSEKDILKLVNTIIANTKGDGEKSGEDFWVKAERLLYCALIGYIYYEAPEEEQNFSTLLEFINASEAREDDEEFKNPVDELFEDLEKAKPEHFAVRQYKKYKLAAGDICSK